MANESKVFRYDMAEPHPILSKNRDYNKNPRKFYCKLSGILNHSLVNKQANYTYSFIVSVPVVFCVSSTAFTVTAT